MNTPAPVSPVQASPKRLPESQRSTYQFPVYRWINWLAVAGYGIGLVAMFFLSALVGLPAAILWPFFVFVFSVGVALLGRPKALLNFMMFYFLLMPSNRLFGLLPLPLPGFIDELFFIPFIAVIIMQLIQGRTVKGAGWFPVLFVLVTVLSWYVNGKPSPFTTLKILLVNLKFFIVWYFCRLMLPFKDTRELFRWTWLYILFAGLQFFYNVLWHRAPWPRFHPDFSGGVFGPDSLAAHVIGYISTIALFLLMGWGITRFGQQSFRRKLGILALAALILYDLAFMTDTKHVLVLGPLACAGVVFLPGTSAKFKIHIGLVGLLVLLVGLVYLNTQNLKPYIRTLRSFGTTPKGQLFKAVTVDFHHLVKYPALGAGPGLFASDEAREHRVPLARRYILPYYDDARRLGYFGRKGTTVISSVAGSVNTDFFFITSEFGWAGELVYAAFWVYCVFSLFVKGIQRRGACEAWGVYLALSMALVLVMMLQLLTSVSTVGCLAFPLWMLVGRIWDMPLSGARGNGPDGTLPAMPGGDGETA